MRDAGYVGMRDGHSRDFLLALAQLGGYRDGVLTITIPFSEVCDELSTIGNLEHG